MEEVSVFSFLDQFNSKEIAFGGLGICLFLFVVVNFMTVKFGELILWCIVLFFASVMTGFAADTFLSDRSAASVVGIWAPLTYGMLLTIWLKRQAAKTRKKTTYDHLIDNSSS